jgi:hypothetical protein
MAAEAQTVTAPGTISPKVFWPLLVGVALTFVSAFLAGLTPEVLTALGPMAVPMAFALGAVSQTITAYMKSDELRDLGVRATAAVLPVQPTSVTTPPHDYSSGYAAIAEADPALMSSAGPTSTGSTALATEEPLGTSNGDAAARMREELQGGVA